MGAFSSISRITTIMSEETPNEGLQDGISWVIDPLDGTANFIHGFPFVAVSIAVCEDKRPTLGFVLDPVRRELFSARRGGGAYLNGEPIRTAGPGPQRALVATGFPHRTERTSRTLPEHVPGHLSGGQRHQTGRRCCPRSGISGGRTGGWLLGSGPQSLGHRCGQPPGHRSRGRGKRFLGNRRLPSQWPHHRRHLPRLSLPARTGANLPGAGFEAEELPASAQSFN